MSLTFMCGRRGGGYFFRAAEPALVRRGPCGAASAMV